MTAKKQSRKPRYKEPAVIVLPRSFWEKYNQETATATYRPYRELVEELNLIPKRSRRSKRS